MLNKNNHPEQKIVFSAIGFFCSEQTEPYHAARQTDENSLPGVIELRSNLNFEQALNDLIGCSHLWIIYQFHRNENWKPLVQTPRSDKKIGVFATRAPYRPNPIGMSAVTLEKIDGLKIFVGPNDLLDGTPILDIKPYHPESDLIQNSKIAWLGQTLKKHIVQFSPLARDQLAFLKLNGLSELKTFLVRQLEYDPINSDKKRVSENSGYWTMAYRTWRVDFILIEDIVSIIGLRSGYSDEDLKLAEDSYKDKDLHKKFLKLN